MSKLKNRYLVTALIIVLSAAAIFLFKANWGIDYADADLYIVKSDNVAITDNAYSAISQLKNLSRIERINNDSLYLYFQNQTDNKDQTLANVVAEQNLKLVAKYLYRFPSEEFRLIANRTVTFALAIIVIAIIFYGADLRGLGWRRWQVGYYIFNDLLMSLGIGIIVLGLASVFGQLGLKMDNDFVSYMGIVLGIIAIYRVYELEIIKQLVLNSGNKINYSDLKVLISNRRPELIMLSCVLLLFAFLPFAVLLGKMIAMAVLVGIAIVVNYYFSSKIKTAMLIFILEQGENTKLFKKSSFQKIW
jgi:hypothetical protein